MVKNQVDILNNIDKYKNYKYWYGAKGEIATKALADRLKKENPSVWTTDYYNKALKDIDGSTRVCDCSGMVCGCYEISNIGSYAINETFTKTNEIKNGMILWRKGHVGLYANSKVYQMKSQALDFYVEDYKPSDWTNILYDKSIDYDYAYNVGWHSDNGNDWYAYGTHAGEYYKSGIFKVGEYYYAFDDFGYKTEIASDKAGRIHMYNTQEGEYQIWQ